MSHKSNFGETNMKSNAKLTIIILITLGIFFAIAPMITINPSFITANSDVINFDKENLKISATTGKIHIDNNWTDAWSAGICTGNGTYSEPYVIDDLVIDAEGSGSGIFIENSIVYFKIKNCTLYGTESGSRWGAGIRLSNVNNSQLIGNNCSSNYVAIYLSYNDYNNTITGNIVNDNGGGIYLSDSYYNTISGNTINNNIWCGIYLDCSSNNIISGNTACNNSVSGIYSSGIFLEDSNYNIIEGNTLNYNERGIALSGSYNNISGNTANNNNDDGIFIIGNNNIISGNTANNNNDYGIGLHYSNNNTITGNTANNNDNCGIRLLNSNYNIVSGNVLMGNYICILETDCEGNIFKNNDCTLTLSLNYLPNILVISITIVGISVFIIYQNRKRFKRPQQDLEFL